MSKRASTGMIEAGELLACLRELPEHRLRRPMSIRVLGTCENALIIEDAYIDRNSELVVRIDQESMLAELKEEIQELEAKQGDLERQLVTAEEEAEANAALLEDVDTFEADLLACLDRIKAFKQARGETQKPQDIILEC